jgi:hypothetical protein
LDPNTPSSLQSILAPEAQLAEGRFLIEEQTLNTQNLTTTTTATIIIIIIIIIIIRRRRRRRRKTFMTMMMLPHY